MSVPAGDVTPKPQMLAQLRQRETARLAETLSRQLNAMHVPHEPGTPHIRRLRALDHHADGQARCHPQGRHLHAGAVEAGARAHAGRAVTGLVQPHRVTWTLDRGRGLPGPAR